MEGTPKAISLQGIVRNQTKIGVQDGQCEDLVNLRFKDGSWRTSGDGKHVFSMNYQSDVPNTSGVSYTQLFIHTNIYHHLLGVCNDRLYWFGNINADGAFEALSTPKELVAVNGDLYINQTGNLLTIIDGGNFTYLLFKSSTGNYTTLNVDLNGSQDSRMLYPFGQIHFNYADAGEAGTITEDKTGQDGWRKWGIYGDWGNAGKDIYIGGGKFEELSGGGDETLHNTMVKMYGDILEKNYFTDPFLVCAAIKLYDGKYMYASAPAMIYPRQRTYNTATTRKVHKNPTSTINAGYDEIISDSGYSHSGSLLIPNKEIDGSAISSKSRFAVKGTVTGAVQKDFPIDLTNEAGQVGDSYSRKHARQGGEDVFGAFRNGISAHTYCAPAGQGAFITHAYTLDGQYAWKFQIRGSNVCVSIDSSLIKIMEDNKDVFKSLCIFITPQSSIYKMDVKDKGSCRVTLDTVTTKAQVASNPTVPTWITQDLRCSVANMSYIPQRRTDEQIRYDLLNSPFYLLKEYDSTEVADLLQNPIIDLQKPEYEGILKNITQQDTLKVEAVSRYSYIPKVQYTYNGRLHIANYTQSQFHGYPLDVYHLNNHSLQTDSSSYFKGTLKGLESFYDETLSAPRKDYTFITGTDTRNYISTFNKAGDVLAYTETEIDTDNGTQKVCRYISMQRRTLQGGTLDFVETLDALLTFPDNRAKSITVQVLCVNFGKGSIEIYRRKFDLKPHPYLNMAYYMADNLQPSDLVLSETLSLSSYTGGTHQAPKETNASESFPNGLKVSATNNPLYFPVENTYQVGSAEIVAMMSNSIAVGTGQTGSAPLYIFCKDGVYAMFVDSTGETTYTNSRIIARDVCNNQRSVTPIDTGVVFTTDRGLMQIAGEQVAEIGQPMEGDWVKYTTQGSMDFSKIAKNAYYMKRIAALPDETTSAEDSMTQVDFLEYLKGSIINYNHNERELMVSNPAYHYTYILDREGNWSRRDIRAEQYVNNYPTSYRVEGGELYQVDKDSDADNGFFAMSHVMKLDSIGFKELHRLVARGYFETISKKNYTTVQIPETTQTIELSPGTATIAGWNEETNTTKYVKSIHEELYSLDIPVKPTESKIEVELPQTQQISLLCKDGCSIDKTASNKITITYNVINTATGEVLVDETFNTFEVADDKIIVHCEQFDYIETLAPVPHRIVLTFDAEIHLVGDNRNEWAEFNFNRMVKGDGPVHHTVFGSAKIENMDADVSLWHANVRTDPTSTQFKHNADSDAYFAGETTGIGDYNIDNYLVIPEGYKATLEIIIPEQSIQITAGEGTDKNIVAKTTVFPKPGSSTTTFFKGQIGFHLCDKTGNHYLDCTSEQTNNVSDDEITTIYTSTGNSYSVCNKLNAIIHAVSEKVELPAGRYYQYITTWGLLLNEQQNIHGLEFQVYYKCKIYKSDATIQNETTGYETIGLSDENMVSVPSEIIAQQTTNRCHSIDADITIPILNPKNSTIVQYNSVNGKITSFTIPDGYTAIMRMKLEGIEMTIGGYANDTPVIREDFGGYTSQAGNGVFRICNDKGDVLWSSDTRATVAAIAANCEVYFNMPDEYDMSEIVINLPAGTYHTELAVSGTQLCTFSNADDDVSFKFAMQDMDMYVTLEVSAIISNTFGMQELVLPSITQQLITTIPAHTEQVIDPDKTYDTILGLYVFGSYDGRKWACLGHREKSGEFRDIGTLVERTDCRFFRFILAGQVSKNSRLDYFEVSSRNSKLNTKIR